MAKCGDNEAASRFENILERGQCAGQIGQEVQNVGGDDRVKGLGWVVQGVNIGLFARNIMDIFVGNAGLENGDHFGGVVGGGDVLGVCG